MRLVEWIRFNNYTGEDIFRGIFFLEGDFVYEIPSLYNAKVKRDLLIENPILIESIPEFSEEYLAQEAGLDNESLIYKIEEFNPKIFEELKTSISTENPKKIQSKLEEAALLLRSALLTNENFKRNIRVIQDGIERGGISPKDYDLTKKEEVIRYNNDMKEFLELDDQYNGEDYSTMALAIVFLVT